MLDKNNSLLTAISDEECATVCGGYGFIFNPDGSISFTSTSSGETIQQNGNDVTSTKFTSTTTLTFSSENSLPTLQGSASTPDKNQAPINFSLLKFV